MSEIITHKKTIEHCFTLDSMEEILSSLETTASTDTLAAKVRRRNIMF